MNLHIKSMVYSDRGEWSQLVFVDNFNLTVDCNPSFSLPRRSILWPYGTIDGSLPTINLDYLSLIPLLQAQFTDDSLRIS